MKRSLRFPFLIHSLCILLVSLLGGCSSSEGGAAPQNVPLSQSGPCRFAPPAGVTVDCGRLTVAENRKGTTPAERGSLELAVAIFRAHTPTAMSVPLVYLAGGPGEGAIDDVVTLWSAFGPLADQRDLVVIDQRGTGYSKPNLACSNALLGTASTTTNTPSFTGCRAELAPKVVSLSDFDIAPNAADVDELRRVLGYPASALFDISYA